MRIFEVKSVNFNGCKKEKNESKKHPKNKRLERNDQISPLYPKGKYQFPCDLELFLTKREIEPLDIIKNSELNTNIPLRTEEKPKPFDETHGKLKLDKYQQEAINAFNSGNTTIVTAPTGTGKTLIAEHVIKNSLDKNKKIIYLSPLKALSNEKYSDFAKLFGNYDEKGNLVDTKNTGLLTGDVSINPNAPLLVMTTEIYKNSLLSLSEKETKEKYKDYEGVIYDEFHYLGDKSRGTIWEEAVIHTPKHIKQLMLSATASNSDEIKNWIEGTNSNIKVSLVNVPESERHVPLREFVLTRDEFGKINLENTKKQFITPEMFRYKDKLSERQKNAYEEYETLFEFNDEEAFNNLKYMAGRRGRINAEEFSKAMQNKGMNKDKANAISIILSDKKLTSYKKTPDNMLSQNVQLSEVVKKLDKENMNPSLIYIFSKKRCNEEQKEVAKRSKSLLTKEESIKVYNEVQKCREKGVYLGEDFDDEQLNALMKGFAVHHAGKLPAYKSLVENLAKEGLVKVCFATETLIAGINMPFKTTVFTELEKYDGEEVVDIQPSLFKQGAGRSGRRGKDDIGNVIVMTKNIDDYDKYLSLSKSTDTSVLSAQNPSYASILSDKMLNNTDEFLSVSLSAYQKGNKLKEVKNNIEKRKQLLEKYGFIKKDKAGTLRRCEKGEIAKKVYGVNEIIFTEILSDKKYLKNVDENGLIAVCASFADVKDENPKRNFGFCNEDNKKAMVKICDLIDEVDTDEKCMGIKDKETPFSTNLVPYILKFSNSSSDRDEAINQWGEIINSMRSKELISHEGDFLRVINSTIDILRVIKSASNNEKDIKNAELAIEKLTKPPIEDIYNYELKLN